jgi:single-strand DNA-binding protein
MVDEEQSEMRGINKVILVGTLGNDPEIRHTSSGKSVANISMATTEKWKDGEHTEWHRLVMFGALAEIAEKYLTKGSHVYVEGKIKQEKWEDQEGRTRYTTNIICYQLNMLGGGNPKQTEKPKDDFDYDIPF